MKRRTLAPGIYGDQYGYEVRWVDRRPRTKRFPADAALETLKKFRDRMVSQAKQIAKAIAPGSFPRDVARFLRTRKLKPCYKSDRSHLRRWVTRFRQRSRFAITRADVQTAVNEWKELGYSPRELRHRVAILRQFFRWVDPDDEKTPADSVKLPKPSKRKRPPVDPTIIRDVALNLRKQEMIGRLRDARTRARFLVLALHGERPIQMERTNPAIHVDLVNNIWHVPPAKGDEGSTVVLNQQQRAAWLLFIACGARGKYDRSSFSKTLRRNGWPKGIEPYQLRHTVAQTLKDSDIELAAISDHLGHGTSLTTTDFYVGPSMPQLQAISSRLEGRVTPFAVELPRFTTTRTKKQKAKVRHNAPQSAPVPERKKAAQRGGFRSK